MNDPEIITRSKFATLYFYKQIFGLILGLIIISSFFYNSFYEGVFIVKSGPFVMCIIALIFYILFLIDLYFGIFEIIVTKNGIYKLNFITCKKKFIPYSEIDSSRITKTVAVLVDRPLPNEYVQGPNAFIIKMKDGGKIIITPREFKNCQELLNVIVSKIDS